MTPEEQRIAIEEECGRAVCKHAPDKWERRGTDGDSELYCVECAKYLSDMRIPDYLHDLNAMHEAEETLNENRRLIYSRALVDNFRGLGWQFDVIHATSAQRAEAFLRTIGKWKD